jgi:hypothetical protein
MTSQGKSRRPFDRIEGLFELGGNQVLWLVVDLETIWTGGDRFFAELEVWGQRRCLSRCPAVPEGSSWLPAHLHGLSDVPFGTEDMTFKAHGNGTQFNVRDGDNGY